MSLNAPDMKDEDLHTPASSRKKKYAKPKRTILDAKTAQRELAARMSLGDVEAERMLEILQARNKKE